LPMLISVGLGRNDRRRSSRAALGCLSMPIRVFSRSARVAGLVTPRQTFVRRRHRRQFTHYPAPQSAAKATASGTFFQQCRARLGLVFPADNAVFCRQMIVRGGSLVRVGGGADFFDGRMAAKFRVGSFTFYDEITARMASTSGALESVSNPVASLRISISRSHP
jgi:hypothetical protein